MCEGLLLASVGALGILTVVCFYPLFLLLLPPWRRPPPPDDPQEWPSITIITAARNAAALLPAKIENFGSLDYPADRLSFLIASDASTDASVDIINCAQDPRIRLVKQTERLGKAAAMNHAVELATSELLLFSDADAQLAPDAVRKLARHFSDPQVGGVCGQRRTEKNAGSTQEAQQTYIDLDSALKKAESARGRVTANDGKIHMIRRALFRSIPPDATDDLYTALAVMSQGVRFLFEPEAVAVVPVPSRDARHEIQRRRRIVIRSLTGIRRMRHLLNPVRFGGLAVGLLINKIGRRLMPFSLLLLAVGGILLLADYPLLLVGLAVLTVGLAAGSRLVLYMLVGFAGMALGVIDFCRGRRVTMWEPRKTDGGRS